MRKVLTYRDSLNTRAVQTSKTASELRLGSNRTISSRLPAAIFSVGTGCTGTWCAYAWDKLGQDMICHFINVFLIVFVQRKWTPAVYPMYTGWIYCLDRLCKMWEELTMNHPVKSCADMVQHAFDCTSTERNFAIRVSQVSTSNIRFIPTWEWTRIRKNMLQKTIYPEKPIRQICRSRYKRPSYLY